MISKEDFIKLFINLTEFTTPLGTESDLEKYLPSNFQKDIVGNYYYEIGNSDTLFTCHLDTVGLDKVKIEHVIKENSKGDVLIGTDGKTILGADDKTGVSILIGMIMENKPGTYYLFLGEEKGCFGSKNILNKNGDYFEKFKRIVSFDRRGYGSIVEKQRGRTCCSKVFASEIEKQMTSLGLPRDKNASVGIYTDSAVFMDVVPECTNISTGYFNEHWKDEFVNISYTYSVLECALKMDWESLPVHRKIDPYYKKLVKRNKKTSREKPVVRRSFKGEETVKNKYSPLQDFNREYRGKYARMYSFSKEDFVEGIWNNRKKEYEELNSIKGTISTFMDFIKGERDFYNN